jgi:tetratricopeptide (TPR) repeat protein
MMRRAVVGLLGAVWPLGVAPVGAQAIEHPAQRAESLWVAGRPWHAAETLLDAAARNPRQDASFIVRSAEAELEARRFDRARSLLIGQPWLEDYGAGEALRVLGEAEWRLGEPGRAAQRFVAARGRARGPEVDLLAVRAALAFEAAGLPDSAARYYAAARSGGLRSIEPWLRLREARVSRDTSAARRLLVDLPAAAARGAAAARAGALLTAGDSGDARAAFRDAGLTLPALRLALALGDTAAAARELYALFARAPQSDDAAAGVPLAHGPLPPRSPADRVALARVLRGHGAATEARQQLTRALAEGDSSGATLIVLGELLTSLGR